jgi:thiol:disulfide interchange protein DsbD
MMIKMRFLLLVASICFSSLSFAGDFLPPDQAFQYQATQEANHIQVHWKIEHGYYLYEQRIYAYVESDDENIDLPIQFASKSELKLDKNFGEVAVFFDTADASVDISGLDSGKQTVSIEYQGCAKDGLCYQPQIKTIDINQAASPTNKTTSVKAVKATAEEPVDSTNNMSSTADISRFLEHASLLSTVGIFLLLGIGLSLTPCILPMIPILSGIIVGHGDKLTTRHGILLSSAYVLGMAVSYALAGVIAATFGAQGNIQTYMQNPWVISVFALVFVVLSLSMFGLYNLALPTRLQNALYNLSNKQKGGHLMGVFVMGALSALVVSPCVSAPLAGALVFISSTGDKLVGGLALFALGIGMGFPLIAIGAGGGKLVPKAGMWMNHVKHFFGVILLAVAIWLLSRIIPNAASMMLWALLLIIYGIHSGALEPATSSGSRLGKAASFLLVFYGCLLFIGSVSGSTDPLKPMQFMQTSNNVIQENKQPELFTRIQNNEDLTKAIKAAADQHKPVMLDFYADWCTACIDMENNVFNKDHVHAALNDFVVLQIDVTANTAEDQAVLNRFHLFGPPSMLFFKDGKQLEEQTLQGELPADDFVKHIKNI